MCDDPLYTTSRDRNGTMDVGLQSNTSREQASLRLYRKKYTAATAHFSRCFKSVRITDSGHHDDQKVSESKVLVLSGRRANM
jgi:hypothetical protein